MGLRTLSALVFLAILGLNAPPAGAAVLKCKAKDGSITYTQTSCPAGTTNADFPEEANPNRVPSTSGNSYSNGGGTASGKLSSSKAAMYRDYAIGCAAREDSESCDMLDEVIDFCRPKVQWPTESCTALREGMQAARDEMAMSDVHSKQRLRQICAKGGEMACVLTDCPLDMFIKGTDEQVRACAARAGMPVSGTWIRLESKTSGGASTGYGSSNKYVCLKKIEILTEIGERLFTRETVTVMTYSPINGGKQEISVSSLPNDKFATTNEAATAGCEAKTRPRQPDSTEPARKKKSQGV